MSYDFMLSVRLHPFQSVLIPQTQNIVICCSIIACNFGYIALQRIVVKFVSLMFVLQMCTCTLKCMSNPSMLMLCFMSDIFVNISLLLKSA